jgi:hypothetical protein
MGYEVRMIRQSVSLFLLVVVFGVPAMACLTPGIEMTTAERECCKHMAQHCGSMNMPASHSCCRREMQRPNSMLRAARMHVVPPVVCDAIVGDLIKPAVLENEFLFVRVHPPTESPPGTSSILRI